MFHQQLKSTELYDILGLDANCTKKDIKSAYKELALKYHPDKLKENCTEEDRTRFPKISDAYEILSDDEKRDSYDKYGISEPRHEMQHTEVNIADIFQHMFPNGFHTSFDNQTRGLEPIIINVELKLEEIINGVRKNITFERTVLLNIETNMTVPIDKINQIIFTCEVCKGTGIACNVSKNKFIIMQSSKPCAACKTTGYYNSYPSKYKIGKKKCKFDYKFPKGVKHDEVIKIGDVGHIDLLNPTKSGPVSIKVLYEPIRALMQHGVANSKFILDEHMNLIYIQDISIFESITGTEFNINHPNGKKLYIEINDPIPHDHHNSKKIIKGMGIPQKTQNAEIYTDLIIVFKIIYPPTNLSQSDIKLLKTKFAEYYHQNIIFNDTESFTF